MNDVMQKFRRYRHQARKLRVILGSRSMARGLLHGVAAGIEHLPVLRCVSIATLVDIGANVGQFTLAAFFVHPNARVYAFEPLADAADRYERLFKDFSNVRLFRCAIGERSAQKSMNRARAADSSSLLEISPLQSKLFPGTERVNSEAIGVKPLTDLLDASDISSPAFLKIDVQGFELQVLEGAERLLSRFEWIYVECSFVELYVKQAMAHEIIAFLDGAGFTLKGVFNQISRPPIVAVQADFLFRRKEI